MKVHELIAQLQKLPQDLAVLMSRDEEGNGFRMFSGDISVGVGQPGDDGYDFTSRENWEEEPEEYDGPYPGDNSILLWP